jgi:hypothetical protein
VPYETAALAAAVLAQSGDGLKGPDAARQRERFTEHRTQLAVSAALSGQGLARRPDDGETARERNERLHAQRGTAQPREFGEAPVCGSLGYYEAG